MEQSSAQYDVDVTRERNGVKYYVRFSGRISSSLPVVSKLGVYQGRYRKHKAPPYALI